MIEFLNENFAVIALVAVLVGFIGVMIVLSAMLARQNRRYAAMLRRLDGRVTNANGRLHASVQTLNQSMGAAAAGLNSVSERMEDRQERMRREVQEKLDEMRETLGARMQKTLEARLGESFSLVNGQLESVYKGLGEMRKLAEGVGDLKKVLAGVKTRGVWGEVRLRALIEENLTSAQFDENVAVVPGSQERVEFAVRLPGGDAASPVWLPIDSKLPLDDYTRLVAATEAADKREVERCAVALENALMEQAKLISRKYINPPHTTDFAIMFLPLESLYGEALSRGISEKMQSKYRVMPTGPSAFAALLNCLQMGFRTLAVEKRTGEILRMLGGVKQEFARFGETLGKARARLEQAAGDLDSVGARTRALNRRLNELESETGEFRE